MQNLSDIDMNTSKDNIINNVIASSGLSKKMVTNLYESFAAKHDSTLVSINESFVEFLEPKFVVDEQLIADRILELSSDPDIEPLLTYVNEVTGTTDSYTTLRVIASVLSQSDSNFVELNESMEISLDDTRKNNETLLPLFESLRDILSKNNPRWGNNYHLDNSHKAILEYLGKEIQEITNEKNMFSLDTNFHMDVIKDILFSNIPNPLYLNISSVKTLVPDIQTLVFDSMLVINNFISIDQHAIEYINRNTVIGYNDVNNKLFGKILSSSVKSRLLNKKDTKNPYNSLNNNLSDELKIDYEKFDIIAWGKPKVTAKQIANLLGLIKSCGDEFQLPLRKLLNIYVTKALELVIKIEKYQLANINK